MRLKRIVFALSSYSGLFTVTAVPVDLEADISRPSNTTTLATRGSVGINCKGSGLCKWRFDALEGIVARINTIGNNTFYSNGEHILCDKSYFDVCAFLQKLPDDISVSGSGIKVLAQRLVDYGCEGCGSVPVYIAEGINDVHEGMLTVNMARRTGGCNGPCKKEDTSQTSEAATLAKRRELKKQGATQPSNVTTLTTRGSTDMDCKGSPKCGQIPMNFLISIKLAIDDIDDNRLFFDGQHIVCLDGGYGFLKGYSICVWVQGFPHDFGLTGSEVKFLIQHLEDNGCEVCGRVSFDLETGEGMLIVDAVSSWKPDGCNGVCNPAYKTPTSNDTTLAKRKEHGINCKGSALCATYRTGLLLEISHTINDIDDNVLFYNGEHIVCINGGLDHVCVFLQKLPDDVSVMGSEIKDLTTTLMVHGCGVCGSIPVYDDIQQGMLTVSVVRNSKANGCDGMCINRRDTAQTSDVATTALAKRTEHGINCKGSGLCNYNKGDLEPLQEVMEDVKDDMRYYNGEHIACQRSSGGDAPMCAFFQKLPNEQGVLGSDIKTLTHMLVDYGCEACGSVPVYTEDVQQGMLTFNIVDGAECEGVCQREGWPAER